MVRIKKTGTTRGPPSLDANHTTPVTVKQMPRHTVPRGHWEVCILPATKVAVETGRVGKVEEGGKEQHMLP